MLTILFLNRCNSLFAGLAFLLMFICSPSIAQNIEQNPSTDTAYINKQITAGFNVDISTDSAIKIFTETLRLSTMGKYNFGCIHSLRGLGWIYSRKDDLGKCLEIANKMLAISKTPGDSLAIYYNIGRIYLEQGDDLKASTYLYIALQEKKRIRGRQLYSTYVSIYASLAHINADLQEDGNEIYYLRQAEDICRQQKLYDYLCDILQQKAYWYADHKINDSISVCLQETSVLIKKYKFIRRQISLNVVEAVIALNAGEYKKTLTYMDSAIALEQVYPFYGPLYFGILSSYVRGSALYHCHRYKEAAVLLTNAVSKAAKIKMKKNIIDAYQALIGTYRATGQYKKALNYADSLIAFKDSLVGLEKANAINQMEIKYKTAEKDKALAQNQLLIAEQKAKLARKNLWILAIGGSIVLLLLVTAGLYLRIKNKQRSIEKENKIEILRAAVVGGDNERARIARELHDGIGGMLSAAMMRFSSMHHEEPMIIKTAAYTDAMTILREMGDEIRKTAHNLMPEVLLKQSLPEAVRVFCNSVHQDGGLTIDFQSYGSFEHLSQTYKLNVYRIVQELVRNVIKHAHASYVLVQLLQNECKLIVSVEDNGQGFDPDKIREGQGLINIRTRVSSMDGHFIIESRKTKGTTLIIELPIHIEV